MGRGSGGAALPVPPHARTLPPVVLQRAQPPDSAETRPGVGLGRGARAGAPTFGCCAQGCVAVPPPPPALPGPTSRPAGWERGAAVGLRPDALGARVPREPPPVRPSFRLSGCCLSACLSLGDSSSAGGLTRALGATEHRPGGVTGALGGTERRALRAAVTSPPAARRGSGGRGRWVGGSAARTRRVGALRAPGGSREGVGGEGRAHGAAQRWRSASAYTWKCRRGVPIWNKHLLQPPAALRRYRPRTAPKPGLELRPQTPRRAVGGSLPPRRAPPTPPPPGAPSAAKGGTAHPRAQHPSLCRQRGWVPQMEEGGRGGTGGGRVGCTAAALEIRRRNSCRRQDKRDLLSARPRTALQPQGRARRPPGAGGGPPPPHTPQTRRAGGGSRRATAPPPPVPLGRCGRRGGRWDVCWGVAGRCELLLLAVLRGSVEVPPPAPRCHLFAAGVLAEEAAPSSPQRPPPL